MAFLLVTSLVQQAEIYEAPSMLNGSNIQLTLMVFLLSFGVFICITNYS